MNSLTPIILSLFCILKGVYKLSIYHIKNVSFSNLKVFIQNGSSPKKFSFFTSVK